MTKPLDLAECSLEREDGYATLVVGGVEVYSVKRDGDSGYCRVSKDAHKINCAAQAWAAERVREELEELKNMMLEEHDSDDDKAAYEKIVDALKDKLV